ncbi:hypothetical protein Bpfe_030311, partial [Biomphalaria pfeifferi]
YILIIPLVIIIIEDPNMSNTPDLKEDFTQELKNVIKSEWKEDDKDFLETSKFDGSYCSSTPGVFIENRLH